MFLESENISYHTFYGQSLFKVEIWECFHLKQTLCIEYMCDQKNAITCCIGSGIAK